MTRALTLEDFGTTQPVVNGAGLTSDPPVGSEEDRLTIYESGYQSGWDDCAAAETEGQRRIGVELSANLRDLSLTYEEARRDVLEALGPLFEEMAAQLLPALAAEAIAPAVITELQDAAKQASGDTITLVAAPAALPALERLAETQTDIDISVHPEPAYAEGQVSVRFGQEQRDIDLRDAAARMAEAIRGFVQHAQNQPLPSSQGSA